jgi:amidase
MSIDAVVTLAEEQARDNAQRAEQAVMKGEPLGALHGLPLGIKDITQTAAPRSPRRF